MLFRSIQDKTYTGKPITQDVIITKNGKPVTVDISYKNNINAGTAQIIIDGKGEYSGRITETFKITKAKQPFTVKASVKSVKADKLRKAKRTVKKAFKVKNNKGALSLKKLSGSKYIKISKKGVVTVKKGKYKKNTLLKIKVRITAKGNSNYKKGSKNVTVKIKVK